ncbi:nineteen complex-related protein 2-domain-containing protein [Apiospora arundinis]
MFGAKRKVARKIKVQDDEDEQTPQSNNDTITQDTTPEEPPLLQASFKSRKPSALRKTTNITDDDSADTQPKDSTEDDENSGGAPLRIRPSLGGRGASSKLKKRGSSSRLSFGPSTATTGDDDDGDSIMLGGTSLPYTPKKANPLAVAATENSAFKKGITKNNRLPLRSMETDEDRPRYSKEYLSELQNSTPNTPANLAADDDDVEMSPRPLGARRRHVLTDAEILEKKERRSRLAAQAKAGGDDFISLSDDERGTGDSYLAVLSRKPAESTISAKKEKRLVADDNLDDDDSFFVEDGGLSLGRKAERAARRKKRADMQAMIASAEGVEDEETSDDSEAERRAAYEKAQTRAGMDGLAEEREQQRRRLGADGRTVQVPPKITPLPDLSVLVEDFKAKMGRKQLELQRMRAHINELRTEREGIEKREPEVQKLLNDAGERYKALMGGPTSSTTTTEGGEAAQQENTGDSVAAAKSLLEQAKPADTPGRGLESLGATPVRLAAGDQMEM